MSDTERRTGQLAASPRQRSSAARKRPQRPACASRGTTTCRERAVSLLDVSARILGLDPATRDALFCGVGSRWFEDLGAMPKLAILDALDRTMSGAAGAGLRKHPAAARHDR